MKTFLISLWILGPVTLLAQNIIPVSSTGIGELKINMTLEQVEKISGKTIQLEKSGEDAYIFDTVRLQYKGIQMDIEFYTAGEDEKGKPKKMVYGITASHPSLQTRSGFTLGTDKFEIVKKLDGMYLTLQPDWRMDELPDKDKYSILMLTDGENGTQLVMYFKDNKLTGFHVTIHEGC